MALRTVKNHTKIVQLFAQKINGAISSIRVIALEAGGACILPLKCFFNVNDCIATLNLKSNRDRTSFL